MVWENNFFILKEDEGFLEQEDTDADEVNLVLENAPAEAPVVAPSNLGTVVVGTGTMGTRIVATRYPVAKGLTAGTTKQTGNPNL